MKRLLLSIGILIISAMTCYAQEMIFTESWSGEISLGSSKLNIGFTIKHLSDGQQVCTMDVPEQGAKNIPVLLLKNDSDSLNLSIPLLRAAYQGHKTDTESIVGVFNQNGYSLPLNLKPGEFALKRPQTPTPPFEYLTEEVTFSNEAEGALLAGTLTYPVGYDNLDKGSVPVVLMVTGSGLQERNEEIFDHKPFFVIADFLARNGIASLRYDDRGAGKSTGSNQGTTTMNNLADAEAGIAYLRNCNKFGKIGVLGHSEGGTIAFMMGANKSVDFLISLAGGAASGIDIIVGQNEAAMQLQGIPQELTSHYATALRLLYNDRIERKEIADPSLYVEELCQTHRLTLPSNYKSNLEKCLTYGDEWLTWFLQYNPADAICQIVCPAMVLYGNLDLQVLSKDNLPVIEKNLPPNDMHFVKEYHSLNHLFQHCTPATALDYAAIEETISEEVLSDIAKWIKSINEQP